MAILARIIRSLEALVISFRIRVKKPKICLLRRGSGAAVRILCELGALRRLFARVACVVYAEKDAGEEL
jgi:hypothetical protein